MGINVDCPKTRGGFVHVSLGVQPCCKCRASQGSGGAAVGILCQQDPVDAETRYLPLQKLVLALVHATRKLSHYFQAHAFYVLIEYPL